ncbi:HAD family hydrolase [Qipengyuania sediminis]|uniref:HAD family hydrolase n=1 Tax=Qipengyuania sediminis TaxID=1532023 RepID=UPI00105AA9EF|nr:HAD family hydrolase [Qipengyuania sediminis]
MTARPPRPLVVCDCDEVLLHMVAPFRDWLAENQGVTFRMKSSDFSEAMRWTESGERVEPKEIWRLLRAFFETEMARQRPIAGAVEAMAELAKLADVVVLTNLLDAHRDLRQDQLTAHDIAARVYTNQGPKGPALAAIIAEYSPSHTFFVDDLPQHHQSARETVGNLTTLHLCGEPMLAPHIACAHAAGHADARIDTWAEALPWLLARIEAHTPTTQES